MVQMFQIFIELIVNQTLDERAHLTVAESALGLSLKLRIFDKAGQHHGHALAVIVAGEVRILFLQDADAASVFVHGAGIGGLEARFMRAALAGGNGIDIGKHALGIAVGQLKSTAIIKIVLSAF